jgi:hypothetical protein
MMLPSLIVIRFTAFRSLFSWLQGRTDAYVSSCIVGISTPMRMVQSDVSAIGQRLISDVPYWFRYFE